MRVLFTERAWDDYLWWQAHDRGMLRRVNALIAAAQRAPLTGIGKPEPLKHGLKGLWSRRIDNEHRLVYEVSSDTITIVACRYHYQ